VVAFHASGRQGSTSGTQGWVKYQLGDDNTMQFKFAWDVQYIGANTWNQESSNDDLVIAVDGWNGSGTAEAPLITVVRSA
jgi:hypothetical protein